MTDLCFQLRNRTIHFILFLPKEFHTPPSDNGDLGIIQTFMEVSHAFPSEDFAKNEPTRVEEQPFIPCSNRKIQTMDRHAQHERVRLKLQLDAESDFTTHNNQICFHQSFETVSARETFCTTPEDVIESCRALLDVNLNDTVAKVVREHVHITIGCNTFPLFSLVSGGNGRTLFSFRCVYANCSSFMDIRTFALADKVKWIILCLSHSHGFDTFPARLPRNTIQADVLETVERMVAERRPCSSIKLTCNALCSNSVFQNVLRNPRSKVMNEQSRALRDTVHKSDLWGSEIHLDESNVFVEAFFINSALVSNGLEVVFVFVDDTSCTNSFMFPVIAVLCQDASKATHAVGWGIVRNRTTETFIQFFTFISTSFPRINAFMCDRHYAQSKAIRAVFGDGVHIFHCCVHIARNIKSNTGCDGGLVSKFWAMRFKRTEEAEEQFISSLRRMHSAKKSVFTSQLLESADTYLPSKVDPVLSQYVSPMFTFPGCCVDGLHPQTPNWKNGPCW